MIFLILSGYSYLIYPCLLWVLSRMIKRDWVKQEITPTVSVIISAYNEEAVIDQKIRNTLALSYPENHLEVIVSSDGSTDRTNEIVSAIKDPRLTLFSFPERKGKTACLNRVVYETKGEILVFSDANSMFPSDLLTKLIRNFADENIGLVSGWTKYKTTDEKKQTTGVYSEFEKWTKHLESQISSCAGADGAIFAIRKAFYQPLQDYDINDFVIPLNIIKCDKRAVLDPEVFCHEEPSKGAENEYKRQVRITTRTLGAIRRNIEFLNPFKFGLFSFFLLSHKVIRFLAPVFLLGGLVMNVFLLERGISYIIIFSCQILMVYGNWLFPKLLA